MTRPVRPLPPLPRMARPALGARAAAVAESVAPDEPASPHDELASLFKALGDPIRLRIVAILLGRQAHEACVGELLDFFHQSGPTISHHLKILLYSGLLTRRREGTRLYYRLRADELQKVELLHPHSARVGADTPPDLSDGPAARSAAIKKCHHRKAS
ncbi:ArsR/SmtB family transcription factor [Kitasatospora sp. NPDC056651]|uniref:ArsR/SmtB family transcription factor n=1 Tax=Kitasatospora sp. NPDC056651 TaxID=3345892 RepID=UPI00367B0418